MSNVIRYESGEFHQLPGRNKFETRIIRGSVSSPLLLYTSVNPVQIYDYGPALAGEDIVLLQEFEDNLKLTDPSSTPKFVIPLANGNFLVGWSYFEVLDEFEFVGNNLQQIAYHPGGNTEYVQVSVDQENERIYLAGEQDVSVLDFDFNEINTGSSFENLAAFRIGEKLYTVNKQGEIECSDDLNYPKHIIQLMDYFDSEEPANVRFATKTPDGDILLAEEVDGSLFSFIYYLIDPDFFKEIEALELPQPSNFEHPDARDFIKAEYFAQKWGVFGHESQPQPEYDVDAETGLGWYQNISIFAIDFFPNGDMAIGSFLQGNYPDGSTDVIFQDMWWPMVQRVSLRTGRVKWEKMTPNIDPPSLLNWYNRVDGMIVDEFGNVLVSMKEVPNNYDTDNRRLWVLDKDGNELHYQQEDAPVYSISRPQKPDRPNPLKPGVNFYDYDDSEDPIVTKCELNWKETEQEDHVEYGIFVDGQEIDRTTSTSYILEDLTYGTYYEFKVCSIDNSGAELEASAFTEQVAISPPHPITKLVTAFESGQIHLNWEDPIFGNTHKIQIFLDGTLIDEVDKEEEEYSITGLNQLQQYQVRLRNKNELGEISGVTCREGTPYKTFYNDFSQYAAGTFPNDWTIRGLLVDDGEGGQEIDDFDIQVVDESSLDNLVTTGGKVLRYKPSTDDNAHALISWDILDGFVNLDVEIRWRTKLDFINDPSGNANVSMMAAFNGELQPETGFPDNGLSVDRYGFWAFDQDQDTQRASMIDSVVNSRGSTVLTAAGWRTDRMQFTVNENDNATIGESGQKDKRCGYNPGLINDASFNITGRINADFNGLYLNSIQNSEQEIYIDWIKVRIMEVV